MPSWVRFNDTSDRWEYSVNAGGAWNELPLGIRLIDGTAAAPSLAFADDPDTGLYRVAADRYGLVAGGRLLLSGIKQAAQAGHTFYSADGTSYLTALILDNNYTYLSHGSSSAASHFYIRNTTANGTLRLGTAGIDRWVIAAAGHFEPTANLAYDIGSAALKAKSIYSSAYRGQVIKGIGFSGGEYNMNGAADDELVNYRFTIPADTLKVPGDFVLIEGVFIPAANANTKTIRHQLDATIKRISCQTAVNLADMRVRVMVKLYYRTSTTGSWGGLSWINASGASPIAGQGYLMNAGLSSADWTSDQVLALWAQGGANQDVRATDYNVTAFLATAGSTV
ncbi:hypothetical protein LCGC14_0478110 [marine sediment metagenome]|uniref:Uncharacterized protein n=1 Tax=marine sediment metagenome TaxID=412755 RepID=A0A0F9UX73_9ZZZZ